ncbi:MAG: dethiobiotin synthase [Betaproteobacteria bacterium]|nr:dethiobiotin synthase [Betaproteobacteria bacterium]
MTAGYFVTGTDTGVGKTVVACALLLRYVREGRRAVGMKPIAAGAEAHAGGLRNEDVEHLLAAGNVVMPRELVNPYCFASPVAPHIAAAQAGVEIDLSRIERAYRQLAAQADVIVVEGAGGFRVPLGTDADFGELARRLGLPVILVVGMRLGCLNHALLTAEAVRARGLTLAGWIANHIDPEMAVADENVHALEERIGAPRLARIAFRHEIDSADVASLLDLEPLA